MGKIMRITFALAILVLLGPSVNWSAEILDLKIGHVRPTGSAIDKDVHLLTDTISTKTSGRLQFEIYPESRLGDYSVVQERCAFGEVDFYVAPFGTMMDRRLALPNIPFLVSNWAEARQIYGPDSLLMKKMGEILAGENIKLLGGWPVYFGGILLREQPVAPDNPDIKKHLILRVPPIRSFSLTAKALGYTPYPITWVYAKTGLRTGMVDGLMGGGAEGYAGLSSMAGHYLHIRDHFENWFVYMNLALWQKLSAGDQAVIAAAVREMGERRFAVAEAEESASLQALKERGVRVTVFDDQQFARLQKKVQKTVWPIMEKELGPDFSAIVSTLRP